MSSALIKPHWPAPSNVHAYATTRQGGVSKGSFNSLNLAEHVGDIASDVKSNRLILKEKLNISQEPFWLNQTHSTEVFLADSPTALCPEADASYSLQAGKVCVVMTADCLPILVCNKQGTLVAAIHAGWRGLAKGIIEKTISKLPAMPDELLAWIGPAIGQSHYEVGQDVYEACCNNHPEAKDAFTPEPHGKFLANMGQLATQRMQGLGIEQIYGGNHCSYENEALFYSYRRDGETGRMASLIWRSE